MNETLQFIIEQQAEALDAANTSSSVYGTALSEWLLKYAELQEKHDRMCLDLERTQQKNYNRRHQLRMYQEKIELMHSWKGIFRTAGQLLGICH